MSKSPNTSFANIDDLYLDPMNPRLGRHRMDKATSQLKLLEWMSEWKLEELASSYLESEGFWSHEPLIVVSEPIYSKPDAFVVVEGNRRLAALKYLREVVKGTSKSSKWKELIKGYKVPTHLFTRVPYVLADSRQDVQAFLGFRHVTGIKQWDADEKAGFITQLIDDNKFTYEQVARKIGSTTPAVRRHYVAYQVLLQIEDVVDGFPREKAEHRFAVLYDALQRQGTQQYLDIDVNAEPKAAKRPVKPKRHQRLAHFSRWLYGTTTTEPLITDTRLISQFGKILESSIATTYLETTQQPIFEIALKLAGGDIPELVRLISNASDSIEEALRTIHLHKDEKELQKAIKRLGADVFQLLNTFPAIRRELEKEQ
jgi:hypothetical protein